MIQLRRLSCMISFYFALYCEEQSYKLSYSHTLGKARFCNVGLFDIYVMIMTEFRFGARRTTVVHLTLWWSIVPCIWKVLFQNIDTSLSKLIFQEGVFVACEPCMQVLS